MSSVFMKSSQLVDFGYSFSMTTSVPSIMSVMILTSPAFFNLNAENFSITLSLTVIPVDYGQDSKSQDGPQKRAGDARAGVPQAAAAARTTPAASGARRAATSRTERRGGRAGGRRAHHREWLLSDWAGRGSKWIWSSSSILILLTNPN